MSGKPMDPERLAELNDVDAWHASDIYQAEELVSEVNRLNNIESLCHARGLDVHTHPAHAIYLAWCECEERWGVDSGPAKGCLLALVREAWSDSDAYAAPHGERLCWRVDIDPDSWGEDHDHPEGKTEAEALVAALEAAP